MNDDTRESTLEYMEQAEMALCSSNKNIQKAVNFYYDELDRRKNIEIKDRDFFKFMGYTYLFIFVLTITVAYLLK